MWKNKQVRGDIGVAADGVTDVKTDSRCCEVKDEKIA